MLLPSRMAVLNYMSQVDCASVNEVMDYLRPDYGSEAQFTYPLYLDHLMALEANGYVSLLKYEVDQADNLVLTYEITEDGQVAVEKYVPSKFRMA
ncbi:hypothetical protein CBF34_08390 [Vagococcus penaei]|uniref:Uncharacterized protein n=1 Tax=Vagococcus penaei TaxID=633807 RepID=A0A1Q2D627_9ENTE|nr:hypothetical protein [Vagococcus penaei]AQP53771.1 hypothetical protein BW732_05640 [Vagococcus penaei]RSU00398.1 hypothetical protein CBF34_08390 [Vagococcus penaei]